MFATNSCTREHSRKLVKAQCRTNKTLFLLPASRPIKPMEPYTSQDAVYAYTVDGFKRHLDKILVDKMGFFMD